MADDVVRDFSPPTKKVKYDVDAVDAGSSHGPPLTYEAAADAVDETAPIGATGSGTEEKGKADNRDEEEEERQIMNGGNVEARCNGSVDRDDGDKEGVTSDDGDDDDDDDDDNASNISGFSGLSGDEWKPTAGPMAWIQRQALLGADPRELLKELLPANAVLPRGLDQLDLWQLLVQLMSEPPKRKKLPQFNTLDDAVQLIKDAKNIIVLTGAGISVSCGIPDFRSRDGIYARLAVDFPDLPDPQSMFDISYFKKDPRPFFKFAKEIYPGQFEPSLGHMFIKELENHGKLLRNFTQNIDTIELTAGIERVIQCHGSFASASCMRCKASYSCEDVRSDIFAQVVPRCRKCADADEGQQQLQPTLGQSPQSNLQQQQQQLQQPQQQRSEHHRRQYAPSSLEQSASNFSASDDFLDTSSSPSTSPIATIPSVYPSTTTGPVEAIPETGATLPTEYDATAASVVVPSAEQPDVVVVNDASSSSSSSSQFLGRFSLPENVIKPDIVFFGESLPELFHQRMAKDKNVCDLLIVVGSSLKVRPVALIPSSVSPQVPQILINRESLRHLDFDIELLGDCDVICNELLVRLGPNWTDHCKRKEELEVVPLDDLLERGLKEEGEEEERIKADGGKTEVKGEHERKGSDETRKEEVPMEQRQARNKGAEEQKEEMERRDPKDVPAECDDERKENKGKDEKEKEERDEEEVAPTHADKFEKDEAHEQEKMDSCSTSEQDLPRPLQQQAEPQHQQPQHQQPQEQQGFEQPKITRLSIAKYLQPHQSVFLPPSTHIFSGAEVAYRIKMTSEDEGGGGGGGGGREGGDDEDDDLTSSDDSSSGSDREEEEEEEDRGRKQNDEEDSSKAVDVPEEAEREERDSAEPTGFAEAKDGEDVRRRSGDGGADALPAPSVQQNEDK